jgi:hypothetical protein
MRRDLCPTLAVYFLCKLRDLLWGDIVFKGYDDFLGCASIVNDNQMLDIKYLHMTEGFKLW